MIVCGLTVAVAASHDGTNSDGHGQARRHAPQEEANHGAGEAPENDGLSAELIGCPPPDDSSQTLRHGEDGSSKAGPSCNVVLLDAEAGDHLRKIGEDRS